MLGAVGIWLLRRKRELKREEIRPRFDSRYFYKGRKDVLEEVNVLEKTKKKVEKPKKGAVQ